MSPVLHFPSAEKITASLREDPGLGASRFKERGITKAVAELAAKRFANIMLSRKGVDVKVALIIRDLKGGLELSPAVWAQVKADTEGALVACASILSAL